MTVPRQKHALQDPAAALAFFSEIIDGDPKRACAEIRVFDCDFDPKRRIYYSVQTYKKTAVGWFSDPLAAVEACKGLYGLSPYVTLNPVKPEFRCRANNRLVIADRHGATTDDDTLCLRWMLLDLDPKRPSGISSTDEELARAIERRDLILSEHPRLRESAIWGTSGNGAWVLIRLPDYANDKEHRTLVEKAHTKLVERYSDELVDVDPTTKNPSRVMCLPGCYKLKGDEVEELGRPHRVTTLDSLAEVLA